MAKKLRKICLNCTHYGAETERCYLWKTIQLPTDKCADFTYVDDYCGNNASDQCGCCVKCLT